MLGCVLKHISYEAIIGLIIFGQRDMLVLAHARVARAVGAVRSV
jgi:hypothetical protein